MRIAKRDAAIRSITYAEAVEVALCHGWIDSQKRAHDADTFLQKFTPRGPRSVWSRVNRDKAQALIAGGRMRPAGLRAVEQARASGRWDSAYEPQGRAAVPADLRQALARNPKARAFFETLTGANRYAVLFRIQTAMRPETRARRVERFVAMLARGETLHPSRKGAGRRAV
ncbi:MAG: YdeI/OmpD-associated family protein [Gemmatimonadota bacterium]|nr:YdeI/OmpD-associated family protein [Gemmatimonadota bacterium]MDE3173732.1 YdeI/OmpD-associated family protein [Gemmatimonadota bacterium]MDE3216746.1 YdeI/OmpD-associated family protein [Gemmatimonadota bacterium]